MIELRNDALVFTCPEVHPEARLRIDFQRTLRIPDDGRRHMLPPGLGRFPLRHVDDFREDVPTQWCEHGGVMMPMYQAEALWLNFDGSYVDGRGTQYPFAVKVAAGKVDAVTGKDWSNGLHRRPQDYMVVPGQPWIDGYCVEKGVIRQFVAMPLGSGYSAEEQITGRAEHGGLQIAAYPMKREVFDTRFPKVNLRRRRWGRSRRDIYEDYDGVACAMSLDMGLAPGGSMRQEIHRDRFRLSDWDLEHGSRCFVHIANSLVWRAITGEHPPTTPPTAKEYTRAGLPWFDHYDDGLEALEGSDALARLKSVLQMGRAKGDVPLPENESVTPERVQVVRRSTPRLNEVREGPF